MFFAVLNVIHSFFLRSDFGVGFSVKMRSREYLSRRAISKSSLKCMPSRHLPSSWCPLGNSCHSTGLDVTSRVGNRLRRDSAVLISTHRGDHRPRR